MPRTLATSSCVESGLAAQTETSAPPCCSARTRFAVSAVTCRHAAMRTPSSGLSAANRSAMDRRTGICPPAHAMRGSPSEARLTGLVAVVVGLEGPLDRDADVGGLLGAQLGEVHAERVEVQPRDLLVEVLGQDVDLLLVLVVLGEELDLGDRLVGEAV